jgi:toxin YhaV
LSAAPFTAHGWNIFLHPLFTAQVERLASLIEEHGSRDAAGKLTPRAKVFDAIVELAFDTIPQDPTRREYRQGETLGEHRKHWFRAKFGGGRFRFFFRYRADVRVIVHAWVNDEGTLRTYGSRTDAYAVFGRMLDTGNPPDDWDTLLEAASSPDALARARDLKRRFEFESET